MVPTLTSAGDMRWKLARGSRYSYRNSYRIDGVAAAQGPVLPPLLSLPPPSSEIQSVTVEIASPIAFQ